MTLKIFKNRQDTVYFVKLDDKDESLLGAKLIPSNYTRGNYAYLSMPSREDTLPSPLFSSKPTTATTASMT